MLSPKVSIISQLTPSHRNNLPIIMEINNFEKFLKMILKELKLWIHGYLWRFILNNLIVLSDELLSNLLDLKSIKQNIYHEFSSIIKSVLYFILL